MISPNSTELGFGRDIASAALFDAMEPARRPDGTAESSSVASRCSRANPARPAFWTSGSFCEHFGARQEGPSTELALSTSAPALGRALGRRPGGSVCDASQRLKGGRFEV